MTDSKNDIIDKLSIIGFTATEAQIYYELTRRGPQTHLQLSRITGISRTRVYRLVDQLFGRGVIAKKVDDDGTKIEANNHQSLEIDILSEAEKLQAQQAAYQQLQPLLNELANDALPPLNFSLHTYDGVTGFKQMLWNELKTQGELLAFGDGTLEDLVGSKQWAEKQRSLTVEKGYSIREISNKPIVPTENRAFTDKITVRQIDKKILPLQHQIIIYNDTVSTYCWRDGQKTGLEILNPAYAQTMRVIFERYWQLANTPSA